MPSTPIQGLPYPTPDDPVALGANDIRALADSLEMLSPARGPNDSGRWQLLGASTVGTTDENGGVRVDWPTPVVGVMSVVACSGIGWGIPDLVVNVDDAVPPDATGFYVRARSVSGAWVAAQQIRFNWIALVWV